MIAIGAIFCLFIAVLVAFPMAIKNKLNSVVKTQLNAQIKGEVDFHNIELSMLRSFPNLHLRIDSLYIQGLDTLSEDPLFEASSVRLHLPLLPLLKNSNKPQIAYLGLHQPNLRLSISEDGRPNYDILKGSEGQEESSSLTLALKRYEIMDGVLTYDDPLSELALEIEDLQHSGSGNIGTQYFDLTTVSRAASVRLESDGIPYLNNVVLEGNAILSADLSQGIYALKENHFEINELGISLDGAIRIDDPAIGLDLSFSAPSHDVRQFISLIPGVYAEGLNQVKTAGSMSLSGRIDGVYDATTNQFPGYQVSFGIEDGEITNQSHDESISNLQTRVLVDNPSGLEDDLLISIEQFEFMLAEHVFDGKMLLKKLVSDPHAVGSLNGSVDLEQLQSIIPFENIEKLAGILKTEIEFDLRQSLLDRKQYDQVTLNGTAEASSLRVQMQGQPELRMESSVARFSPASVILEPTTVRYENSDLTLAATLENALGLIVPGKAMVGVIRLESNRLNLNPWVLLDADATSNTPPSIESMPIPQANIRLQGDFEEMLFGDYLLQDLVLKGEYHKGSILLERLSLVSEGNDIALSGRMENLAGYLLDQETVSLSGNLQSNKLNLNTWYQEDDPSNDATDIPPYQIPGHVALDLDTRIGSLIYNDLELIDMRGKVLIEDRELVIHEASSSMLGGRMDFAGSYLTPVDSAPDFRMKFDASSLDFKQTFQQVTFLQKLAPIGLFIDGLLTSNLVLEGQLEKSRIYPELNSLSGSGFLETVNGFLSQYKPLEKIADLLNISELRTMDLIGSKNWFTLDKGRLDLEPIDIAIDDLDMKLRITGSQFLDGKMDYVVQIRVPRELLRKNGITDQVDRGYGLVLTRAKELGLNLADSEYINLMVQLGGSHQEPTTELKIVDTEGRTADEVLSQAVEEKVSEVKDSARQRAEEEVNDLKDTILTAAEQVADSIKSKASERIEELKQEVNEKVDSTVAEKGKEVVDSILQRAGTQVLGDSAAVTVDDIKKKLEEFNPFKKKKKKKGEEKEPQKNK